MNREVYILNTNIWISYLLSGKYHHLIENSTLKYNDLLIKADALTAQGQILQAGINSLQTTTHSGNSSLYLSLDIFPEKNQSLREKSDKKPGRQHGT
jgi:hypothetical protein